MEINKVKQTENGYLVNDTISVPMSEGNRHYKMIQEWIAEGNTPEPYIKPVPTYQELRQAEYPSLQEQQDMQYWDNVNGTTVWVDTITAIKEKYPKGE